MAEALTPEQARARLRAVTQGRHVDHGLSVEEAKAKLYETDPGLDVAPLLRALEERDPRLAALGLLPWALGPDGRTFLRPVLERGLLVAFRGLGIMEGLIRHARRSSGARETGGSREGDAGPPSTK